MKLHLNKNLKSRCSEILNKETMVNIDETLKTMKGILDP